MKFLWKLQPVMNRGWQSISVLQMTKWGSGTSTKKKGKWKQRGHLEGENIRNTCSLVENNFILGAMEATGRNRVVFHYSVQR